MGKYASEVVKQAKAWLNKKESDGSHKEIIDVYNSFKPLARGYKVKYTDAWCATFVSAVSVKLGYTSIIPTECSCEKLIALFKKLGVYVENENRTPNVGDIVFYDWQDNGTGDNQGWSDHVGIVSNVSRETFTVIEGNYDNSVKERTLKINGKYLRGFAVPKYDAEPVEKVDNSVVKETYKTTASLNQRKGASTSFPVIQVIPKGASVVWWGYSYITNGTEWKLVEYNGKLGFCSCKYLKG